MVVTRPYEHFLGQQFRGETLNVKNSYKYLETVSEMDVDSILESSSELSVSFSDEFSSSDSALFFSFRFRRLTPFSTAI